MVTGDDAKRVDLVFEGGGGKGIALVGALSVLEDQGYAFENLAGTSAGAIVATLVATGYRASEIQTIIAGQNFQAFMDAPWIERIPLLDRIPLLGPGLNVLLTEGIYEGKYFLQRMTELLEQRDRPVHTFGDLIRDPNETDPRYRYKVQVVASDVSGRRLLLLPRDALLLGVEPDKLEVAMAVRMSMSIPIFFEPVHFPNPESKQDDVVVDGGMLSNFPIWIFDSRGPPAWPTFGVKIVTADPRNNSLAESLPPNPAADIVSYIKSLVSTMIEAHDREYLEQDQFVRTITIPTAGVASTDFNLTQAQAQGLYESGRSAAQGFLQGWEAAGGFAAYVTAYRQGPPQPRRQRVLERMRAQASDSAAEPAN